MKRTAAAFLLLLPLACSDPAGPTHTGQAGILFVSDRAGDVGMFDIFRMDPDGTGVENVTRKPAGLYAVLTLSPDGSRVAFMSDRDGCYNIWTMNGDGTDVTQLTGQDPNRRCSQNPRWSPDGTRIAFLANWESDQRWHTYVMDADGGNAHRVSFVSDGETGNEYAMGWTPDGRVVFWRATNISSTIYTADADGTGTELLFDDPGNFNPVWSLDGSHLAFTHDDVGTSSLVIRDGAGAEDTLATMSNLGPGNLISIPAGAQRPWSPDGTHIAFYFVEDGIRHLAVADVSGTGEVQQLTDDPGHSTWFNGWSPDGNRLVFTSDLSGTDDVYLIAADGTGLVNLTDSPTQDHDALWMPER